MGKPPKGDDNELPPMRAEAQRRREAELVHLLRGGMEPDALLERGLTARLSPNELNTLRRVEHGSSTELSDKHVARLVLLKLASQKGDDVAITALGKQRLAQGT